MQNQPGYTRLQQWIQNRIQNASQASTVSVPRLAKLDAVLKHCFGGACVRVCVCVWALVRVFASVCARACVAGVTIKAQTWSASDLSLKLCPRCRVAL